MRKSISIVLLFILFFASCSTVFCSTEQVQLASFPVTFNGEKIDNQHATYPLIMYRGITYFPMTWDFSNAFGLITTYTEEKGLVVSKSGRAASVVQSLTANNDFGKSYAAEMPNFPVTVNGRLINNAAEPYPILHFRNITYFPLTWKFAVTEFGWDYTYSDEKGLSISAIGPITSLKEHTTETITYSEGDIYEGEVCEGERDGYGNYYWTNGDRYEGDWLNGEITGKGTWIFNDGTVYTGELLNGMFHGKGTITWSNGDKYIGDWKEGKRTGYGIYYFSDGITYQGQLFESAYHGEGTITYPDGFVISGVFENGDLVDSISDIPTGVTATPISMNEIEINWNPVVNADYYYLYYAGSRGGPWIAFEDATGSKTKLQCTDGVDALLYGIDPGDTIYFKVTSVKDKVQSEASEVVNARTFTRSNQTTSATVPADSLTTIKSKIVNKFEGFDYGNLYELENGQIWKQTSYQYERSYAFMPEVLIYLDGVVYKMHVDGYQNEVTVEQVH